MWWIWPTVKRMIYFRNTRYELPQFDTDQHEYDIAPDGKTIVFNFNPNEDKLGDQAYDIVEMDVKSRNATTLIKGGKPHGITRAIHQTAR
ncbi:MAG: hypothetical protein HC782_03380 [Gammaproteobacteria bacterium]|nr:hypothetical protein [Gammaproteobacteria bacterium]